VEVHVSKLDYKFKHTIRVRWKEADVQGIAYFGSYLDFIDVAQVEYFRKLGILTHNPDQRKDFDLSSVKVTLEYKKPAKIDELIDIYFKVKKIGNSSITKVAEIYRANTDVLLTTAEMISVNFDSELEKSKKIPNEIRSIINKFEDCSTNA
tara:strand:+ start:220 stop:672 length:453 start_codon:yes stop_codon:yes gene_type:complete